VTRAQSVDAPPSCPGAPFGIPGFLTPQSIGEVKELARMIALADWAPECYRDIDGNYHQPKLELAIMHGAMVGLGPIAAVQSIAVIGGTPSIWGDGALAVIEQSGLLEDMTEIYESDDEHGLVAVCTMKRRDRPTPIVTRFSMAMAEHAGLCRTEGAWQSYPERMLRMRARSWTMRDGFADVLRGLQLREEINDYAKTGNAPGARRAQGTVVQAQRPRRHTAAPPSHPTKVAEVRSSDQPPTDTLPSSKLVVPDQTATLMDANGASSDADGQSELRADAAATADAGGQASGSQLGAVRVLEIDPGWGSQKIFQHYRAALSAIATNITVSDQRCAVAEFAKSTPISKRACEPRSRPA
jgi:hypothetical protein